MNSNALNVSDFINTRYREYWEYSNKNGKNSVDPREGLPEVVRKIIYASYKLGIKEHSEHKTTELMGETGKYHGHGPSSIEDSIKGVATAYKSQPAARLLEGIGNFGAAPGDEGAAGRYTSVSGTPLLSAIYKDIPFMPFSSEDTGLDQPEYISSPLPLHLINGMSSIGTGKSCYLAEREAKKVVDWIDYLRNNEWKDDPNLPLGPEPMSITGCKTWYEPSNGYIYYEANIHFSVDINDITKKGKYDIITELPPKVTPSSVIAKLTQKLPTRATKLIIDGSGKGRPIYIVVPRGYLKEEDYAKYGLRTARKESILLWDNNNNTMKYGTLIGIAKEWFEDRCNVVTKRINSQIDVLNNQNHKIDLIKEFAEKKMIDWKSEDVVSYFTKLFPETGEEDANIVLSQSARTFLPENLGKNEIAREKNNNLIKEYKNKIKHIGDTVINEARDIINMQERFFS